MANSPPSIARSAPELLAPAGDFDCARAAVENGADAVYFGLASGFNARARAANFDLAALPGLMSFLHQRGVRGYLTLNTLVFTSELAELERTVRAVAAAGVDAVLAQDLGAARLIKAVCPALPIHASTQMTLSSAESIRMVESLGIERVVLARELSVQEIRRIRRATDMPLEVFVHGALCVAYSGQCLTSESLGGRSANRGQCAQACRLPYELICDGQDVDLGAQRYLLSPQDLAAYSLTPELIEAGIVSFKIEGRLKTPEYVANITRHYRQAIDSAVAGRPVAFTPRDVETMELSFSRGFSHGWLDGCDHKLLVPALSSAKHGVRVGRVAATRGSRVTVELSGSLARGDGVVFAGDGSREREQGGRVYEIFERGRSLNDRDRSITERVSEGTFELAFAQGAIDPTRLWVGQELWKTDEPHLNDELRKSFSAADPRRRLPVDLTIAASVGSRLAIEAVAAGLVCRVESPAPLAEAIRHPLTAEVLREQLGRLGGTPFELRDLEARIDGRPMIPLSVLGKLRHALVERIAAAIELGRPKPCSPEDALPKLRARIGIASREQSQTASKETPATPALSVLCRSLAQLDGALASGVSDTLVDFADIRQYADAVERAHGAGARVWLATPRIQKPGEMGVFRAMQRQRADGILARNLAGLDYFARAGSPTIADFSLNATNELTVAYLRELGAERITASYDLNREQLSDLVAATPPGWLEVVIHQHIPMFHMEHCVFCAVLSPGTNKTNCGRPCDTHEVKLRDRIGMEHPLTADVGCRNTLFNAMPQSAAEAAPELIERGVRHFRIELLAESSADQVARIVEIYRDLLAGRRSGREVWSRLQATNRVGVTRGTLEAGRNPLAIL